MAKPLRASIGQVLAFRATAGHLTSRLPRERWTEALSVGLQDTPPGSAPLALAARVEDVTSETWEAERVASRNLVVAWSLRGAPFAHRPTDHDLFSVAALPSDDASWATLLNWTKKAAAEAEMAPSDVVSLVAGEVEALLADGPMTKSDLSSALGGKLPEALLPYCKACKTNHVGEQVLRTSALFGGFVYGPGEDGRFTLVRADEWLKPTSTSRARSKGKLGAAWPAPAPQRATALRRELLRRYLGAYGPADPTLFGAWLGVAVADAEGRFAEAEAAGELVPATVVDGRATAWLHAEDVDTFRATRPAAARGVRLIPPGDPYLQARDRELLVPEPAHQKLVWTSIGSPGALVVDGAVVGTWRPQKKGADLRISVKPFEPLKPKDAKAVEAEAETVARVRGATLSSVTIAE